MQYNVIIRRQVLHNLEEYGNTSAASIPLALAEAVASGKVSLPLCKYLVYIYIYSPNT